MRIETDKLIKNELIKDMTKTFFMSLLLLSLMTSCSLTGSDRQESSKLHDSSSTDSSLVNGEPEDFDSFYRRFHQDSIFQQSRVKFPVDGEYCDFDTTMAWTSSNWEFIKFTIDQVDTISYETSLKKKKRKVIEHVNCKECGYTFEIRFDLVDRRWYLTYRQENNF